jgi:hypothetical protein
VDQLLAGRMPRQSVAAEEPATDGDGDGPERRETH